MPPVSLNIQFMLGNALTCKHDELIKPDEIAAVSIVATT